MSDPLPWVQKAYQSIEIFCNDICGRTPHDFAWYPYDWHCPYMNLIYTSILISFKSNENITNKRMNKDKNQEQCSVTFYFGPMFYMWCFLVPTDNSCLLKSVSSNPMSKNPVFASAPRLTWTCIATNDYGRNNTQQWYNLYVCIDYCVTSILHLAYIYINIHTYMHTYIYIYIYLYIYIYRYRGFLRVIHADVHGSEQLFSNIIWPLTCLLSDYKKPSLKITMKQNISCNNI